TAAVMRAAGHDVVVLCQEPHPERYGFVDAWGAVDGTGVSALEPSVGPSGPGRVVLLRPRIGSTLPVFVVDEYEGFDVVKPFVDLDAGELDNYLRRNQDALQVAVDWHRPDVVIAGHAVPGAAIAARSLAGHD